MKNILATIIVIGSFIVIYTLPVYFLWNWICVDVLYLSSVTFMQAMGITALSGILFKSDK